VISVEELTFSFAEAKGKTAREDAGIIFQDFNWKTGPGEGWVILGPSGCGKTTLLYLLAGLRLPQAGVIRVNGQVITRPRPRTGLIIQDYGLLPWATVRQNIELGWRVRSFYGPDGKHAPRDETSPPDLDFWLERLGLSSQKDKYPNQLSGGQRQRTAIARTLVLQPDLLLMDEPFASLDSPTRTDLQNLVFELGAGFGGSNLPPMGQRISLVVVTHSIEEAAILGQKILVLNRPPNRRPLIFNNPQAGPDFRETRAFTDLCRDLRQQLEKL
jgi:ABC-type nitrate/sulfonate/bicarbonate transport system ATPase subunit